MVVDVETTEQNNEQYEFIIFYHIGIVFAVSVDEDPQRRQRAELLKQHFVNDHLPLQLKHNNPTEKINNRLMFE